ncbi:helicase-related protein [Sulfurimonas diazotrophicus]|uniref:Helicase-related protein n=1 Tax=Sulfurimonas diazotrophicus TaxID=3131939 RepID=A0ABZ3HAI1_9BACT
MAKKKKKLTRLNASIRRYFDGDGFDEGIERVDTATLGELVQTLGYIPESWEREELVRTLRRLWSDADIDLRQAITAFFTAEGRVYPSPNTKEPSVERSEKIDAILETMDVTPSEARALHNSFIEVRTKKITPEKMEAKLAHLRFEQKRARIEKACEGRFDLDDRFEFNALLDYDLFGEQFRKIHPLKTPAFSFTYLNDSDEAELVTEITAAKADVTRQKQAELTVFLSSLDASHPYLSPEQIVQTLKSAPPDGRLTLPPLPDSLLRTVLERQTPLSTMLQTDEEIVLGIRDGFTPEGFKHPVEHEAHLSLLRDPVLAAVWRGEPVEVTGGLDTALQNERDAFTSQLQTLADECAELAKLLSPSRDEILQWLEGELAEDLGDHLGINSKLWRKTLFHWERHIHDALLKRQRQELLGRTIRDFKNLFPLARELRRKLIFYTGPTNSGKTWRAMQALEKADTGYYLAPLRLLALEGYESLREHGIGASLITGEEQLIDEEATHISSTIEMLDFNTDVDVCVIDEVQMLGDRDRGWAWANAIIGAPAKTVIMTGSENAVDAVQKLADYLGEPLEIVHCERKNPLELMTHATPVTHIQPATAVIAFSRKEVLRLKQQLAQHFRVSVVYGNLSPEVRREEARRFREGETEVLVATDAIAMGLNLPIQTILFSRGDKFDGENQRPLTASEIHQISGRAGRYGIKEKGHVGAIRPDVLSMIHKQFHKPARPVTVPFNVMANLEHIKLVAGILEEESLAEILTFFVKNMQFTGPFRAANLESMLEAAAIVDRYELDLTAKFHLAAAPLTLKSPYIVAAYERYVRSLAQAKPIAYIPPAHLGEYALTTDELLEAEDRVKEISLYLWLAYRFADAFVDTDKAREWRSTLNRFIETSLKKSEFVPRCRQCTKPLPLNSEYAICQSCFRRLNREKRTASRTKERKFRT